MQETYHDSCQQLEKALTQWEELKTKDLAALNALLVLLGHKTFRRGLGTQS
jgi:hypothetical protein